MKKIIFNTVVLTAITAGFSSCSKCYDCSYVTEIQGANGVTVKDTVHNDYCTANSKDIDAKRSQGQTCVAKK